MDRFFTFVSNINKIYIYIKKIKSLEMQDFGLKGIHVMSIFHLNHSEEKLTAANLCSLCGEDKAAISRVIADLEKKGLIQVSKNAGKKSYRSLITLSAQGKALADKMDGLIKNAVDKGGAGLSDDDRTVFYDSLGLISNNLQKYISEKEV